MQLARLSSPNTWMNVSPSLSHGCQGCPQFENVIRRQMFYTTAFCVLFSTVCIFAIKRQNFLNLFTYHNLFPLFSKLTPPQTGQQHLCSSSTRIFFFFKSCVRKDYLHILTSSYYRQKRGTWQTNPNSSISMSSPLIISAEHGWREGGILFPWLNQLGS